MPNIGNLKSQQEEVKTEIRQLKNRRKILLNRKMDAERKTRTRRLIEHGAILESIFPAATAMTGEEAKAFLSVISRLPEVVRLLKNKPESNMELAGDEYIEPAKDDPALVKKIGRTTYVVRVHFSKTSKETMIDKIKRMLKNEIRQM